MFINEHLLGTRCVPFYGVKTHPSPQKSNEYLQCVFGEQDY